MKTSELVKKLNNISGIKSFNKNFISVLDSESKCVGEVGTFGKWLHIYNDCPNEASKLLVEYYLTPLEERQEEKKYRLMLSDYFTTSDFMGTYLNFEIESNEYTFNNSEDGVNGFKTQFTQKEIDAMPFDTNFFIKEEVK